MGGTETHNIEWNKPDTQRQIPQDLPYIWELNIKKKLHLNTECWLLETGGVRG